MSRSLDGVLIKRANQRQHFTKEQVQEFAACAHPDTGPYYFMDHFFYIQHPTKGKLLYSPYEYQRKLLETYHNYRFNINLLYISFSSQRVDKLLRNFANFKFSNFNSDL